MRIFEKRYLFIVVFLTFSLLSVSDAGCGNRPTLRLYSGYTSRGQGHLRSAVRCLQKLLNRKGRYGLDVDGYFGPKTESAVISYQKSYRLIVDGIVGPQTWGSLCRVRKPIGPFWDSSCLRNPSREQPKGSVVRWSPIGAIVVDAPKRKFPGKSSCASYIGGSSPDHPGNAADCFLGRTGVAVSGRDLKNGTKVVQWPKKSQVAQNLFCYISKLSLAP